MTRIPLFFTLLLLFPAYFIAADLNSDRTALLALRSSLGGRLYQWNSSNPTPCSWQGVACSKSQPQRVSELHLPGTGLMGPIPAGIIGNLSALNFLSLRYNALTGPVPDDIFTIPTLQYVYLQHNRLSGEIPASVFSVKGLVRLNLAHNNFSGQISPDFNKLTSMATLLLEDNQFSGEIPNLDLPGLMQFNVSNNQLNGTVPSKLSVFPPSSFDGNDLCGVPLQSCGGDTGGVGQGPGHGEGKKGKKLSGGAIAGIVIAGVVVAIILALCLFFLCCRKKKKDDDARTRELPAIASKEVPDAEMVAAGADNKDRDPEQQRSSAAVAAPAATAMAARTSGGGSKPVLGNQKSLVFFGKIPKGYDLDDLLKASAEVLGKGNYGTTYKASLDGGIAVVVKRLKDVAASDEEFRAKMEEVGKLNDENLVALRAYHASGQERLLVYDYMPVGSLSALLHGNRAGGRTPLNWETRSGIALGAARGITYIHSQGPAFSHGNIKSSNILLTESYNARVSDYGLSHIMTPASGPNRVAGYRAPEVTDPRKVSQKGDVYSFGVFLLELLTGKAPLMNEEGVDLPRWVQSVVKEEWSAEVFDAELLRYQNVEEEMVQLLQLAVDCAAQYPDSRPNMVDVTAQIQAICQSAKAKADAVEVEDSSS